MKIEKRIGRFSTIPDFNSSLICIPLQNQHIKNKKDFQCNYTFECYLSTLYQLAGSLRRFTFLLFIFHLVLTAQGQNDKGIQFMDAIQSNDTTQVIQFLADKKLVNYFDAEGNSALTKAIKLGHSEIVRILLENQANVNLQTKKTLFTPLILAVRQHHLSIAKVLLAHNADVNLADSSGRTPLIWCAINDDYEIIPWLILYGSDLNLTTHYGNTALELACWKKSKVSAKILMRRGAKINTQGSVDKGTPLLYSCMQGQYDLALELIIKGADVHAKNKEENSLLHSVAQDKNFIEITRFKYNAYSSMTNPTIEDSLFNSGIRSFFEYLLLLKVDLHQRNKEGYQPIHIACFNDNIDLIRQLRLQGTNLNDEQNVRSATPLICALLNGNEKSAEILLHSKVDVQAKDNNGWTALHFVSRDNFMMLAGIIIQAGGDINSQTNDLWTPLHLSAKNGQDEVTQILLYFGASDTFRTNDGKTAIELALEKKHDKTASLIKHKTANLVDLYLNGMEDFVTAEIKQSKDFLKTDLQGRTLLHAAIIRGKPEFAIWIISQGANINIADSSGNTPLILSAMKNQSTITGILLDRGAMIKSSDTLGMTAMHYAVINEDTGLIRRMFILGADINARSKLEGTPLETACWFHGNLNVIHYLVSVGAQINSKDFKDWSPLSLAVRKRFTEASLWLIKNGANVNFKSKNGESILHLVSAGMLGILLMDCIDSGALINEQTYDSLMTPLHFAVENNNLEFVKILYWNNANLALKTIDGYTALDLAQKEGFNEIIAFLKAPSFNPFELLENNQKKILLNQIGGISYPLNIKNLKGMPLIHCVIMTDDRDILNEMVKSGVDINMRDTQGRSPLLYALFLGNLEIATGLIEYGANINQSDNDGETPYSLSKRRGYKNMLKLLLARGALKEYIWTLKSELIIPKVQQSIDYIARYSPDGKFVLTGSQNNNLTLWDAKTGRIARQFTGNFNSVADISFSPDNKFAVTVEGGRTTWIPGYMNDFLNKRNINLWDIQTGEEVKVLNSGMDYNRSSVIFSPNGNYFCTGGFKGFIDIFNVGRGYCVRSIKAHQSMIINIAWIKDGQQILSAGTDINELKLWDAASGKLLMTFKGHKQNIECFAVSKDGKLVISADHSGEIIFWDAKDGKILKSLVDETGDINTIAISPDNLFFATGHGFIIGHYVAKVRKVNNGEFITGFSEDNALVSLEFSGDAKSLLMSCSGIPTSTTFKIVERKLPLEADVVKKGLPSQVTDFILTPDNRHILSGDESGRIYIQKVLDNKRMDTLNIHNGSISFIEISPYNKHLAFIGTNDGVIVKFDIKRLKEIGRFALNQKGMKGIVFYKSGSMATTMDETGTLYTWNIQNGSILSKTNPPVSGTYRGFCLSPDEKEIIIFGGQLLLYNLITNNWTENLYKINSREIISVVWSKDGKQLWCKGISTNYKVNIISGYVKKVNKSIIHNIWRATYSKNLQYLLTLESKTGDMYIGLYDTRTEKSLQKVFVGEGSIGLVKFSYDQKYLLYLDMETGIFSKILMDPEQISQKFQVPDINTNSIDLSEEGKYLYTGGSNSISRLQLSSQKRTEIKFKNPQEIKRHITTSGESDFAFCNDSGSIYLCNFNKGKMQEVIKGGLRGAMAFALSNDQKFLAGATANKRIGLWDLNSGTLMKTLSDSLVPSAITFSNDNKSLFVGNYKFDKNISENLFLHSHAYLSEWDIFAGRRKRIIDKSLFDYSFIKTSPDNLSIIAADGTDVNFSIKQYNLRNFDMIYTISAYANSATNANFSFDSKRISVCYKKGTIGLFNLEDYSSSVLEGHKSAPKNAVFSPDKNYLFSVSTDNMVKAWDIKTSKELYSLLIVNDSNWMYITPDYYYYASKGALKEMAWSVGGKRFEFDQFDLKYNRPDLLLSRIPYADTSLIPLYYKAYQKRLKRDGFTEPMLEKGFHVPEIKITNQKDLPATTTKGQVKISIHANDSKELLDRIHILINEVPVYGMRGIDLKKKRISDIKTDFNLKLSRGLNKIEFSVLNSRGIESTKESYFISYEAEEIRKPVLHFIAISVSEYEDSAYNLTYAVKDGRDMAKLFSKKNELYDSVVIDTLFNTNATLPRIIKLKEKLMKSGIDDHVILFVSGHGLLDDNLDFYFGTWNINFSQPSKSGVPFDALEGLLDGIPARKKILLLDACHSGEMDKEELELNNKDTILLNHSADTNIKIYGFKGSKFVNKPNSKIGLRNSFELMQTLFSNQSHGSGTVVISAAAGNGYALESALWNNGVFTYSVLDGLVNQYADLNKDQEIYVSELKAYVSSRVEILTGGRQKPTTRNENLGHDFRVW